MLSRRKPGTALPSPSADDGEPTEREEKAVSWHAFISTYLPALILALGTGIVVPAIPTLAHSYHVNFALATFVTTAFLLGNVAGTVPAGWMVDRYGRRKVMLFGPLLTAAVAFLVATSTSFSELVILRFFDGLASQIWLIGRLAGISHSASPSQRGKMTSWMFGMNNTGKLAGPTIGGFLATWIGIRAPFFAYGFLALIALIPAFMFTADTPVRARMGGAQTPTLSLRAIVQPRIAFFCVALFAGLARGPTQADLLQLYAAFQYHLSPEHIGYLGTAAAAISLPIGFIAGWMMDRYGRKRTMVPGFTGVAVCMVLQAVAAYLRLPFTWFVVIFLSGIVTQSLTGGSIQTVGADVAPPEARGKFLGIWRFFGQGGASLSPVIFSALVASVDYGASFLFIAATAAVVAGLLVFKVPETGEARPLRSRTEVTDGAALATTKAEG